MINPYYVNFLVNVLSGGLDGLPYSFQESIDKLTFGSRSRQFIENNRVLIVAVITILGMIIVLVKSCLR